MFLIKIKNFITIKRLLSATALLAIIVMNLNGFLGAQSVTQGYGADEALQRGMIVGTKPDDATKVEPINRDSLDRMLGVVVEANDSPITLSGEDEQAYVATVGRYDVLVSDQNGSIKSGDYITASSVSGIGMLATFEESEILGRAVDNFDGENAIIGSSSISDSGGGSRTVNIGRVQLDIAISKNPIAKSAAVTPEWLGKIGQAIAGKSLSPARIYISAAVFLIGAFIAGAVLYSGVRSSIISIGRNPLSKKSIIRGLLQVIFTSLIIFIISVIGVYLLLKV